jgi:hypothetical protein
MEAGLSVVVTDISLVEEMVTLFNVWIFGDVVPGGISVTNGDDEVELGRICGLLTVVVLLCCGFSMYVFEVENPPFVDDLSVN